MGRCGEAGRDQSGVIRLYSNIFAACKSPRDFVRHPIADYLGLNETVAIDGDIILRQIVRVARSLNVWTWPIASFRCDAMTCRLLGQSGLS